MRKNTSTATNNCTAAPSQFELCAHFAPRAWCVYNYINDHARRAPRARLCGALRWGACAVRAAALPLGLCGARGGKCFFYVKINQNPRGVLFENTPFFFCCGPVAPRCAVCGQGQGTQRQIHLACNKRAATLTSHDCVTLPSSSIASRSARIAAGCFCRAINCCRSASGDAAEPTSYLSRSSEFRVG